MKRGDIVVTAPPGAYGKPRPAVIIQANQFIVPSVTILPFTSDLKDTPLLRIQLEPNAENGLEKTSQIMIDKAVTLPREKIGPQIGRVDATTMRVTSRALAIFLGLEGAL